jgi:hypothetical protein
MEIKNKLAVKLDSVCAKLRSSSVVNANTRVAWAIMRNAAGVSNPVEDIKKILEPTEAMKRLEKVRQGLIKTYATKGPDGLPLASPVFGRPGMMTYHVEDTASFTADFEAAIAQNSNAKEDEQNLIQREIELLEETTEFTPYVLHIADVPDGILDMETMEVLYACGILID